MLNSLKIQCKKFAWILAGTVKTDFSKLYSGPHKPVEYEDDIIEIFCTFEVAIKQ